MNIRLEQFLGAENLSQAQFAAKIKVSPASIAHIIAGRNKPGFDFISNTMLAFPDLNIEWLITGRGKMYKSQIRTDEQKPLVPFSDYSLFGEEAETVTEKHEDNTLSGIPKTPQEEPRNYAESLTDGKIQSAESYREQTGNPQRAERQRKAIKIAVFYDDGTFQEFQ